MWATDVVFPNVCTVPSPKSTITERTVAGAVAAAVTVNVVGESATGVPVAVMLTVGSADAVIVTVAVTAARPPSPLGPAGGRGDCRRRGWW